MWGRGAAHRAVGEVQGAQEGDHPQRHSDPSVDSQIEQHVVFARGSRKPASMRYESCLRFLTWEQLGKATSATHWQPAGRMNYLSQFGPSKPVSHELVFMSQDTFIFEKSGYGSAQATNARQSKSNCCVYLLEQQTE